MPNSITHTCLMINFTYIEQQIWNIRTGISIPYQEKIGFNCSDVRATFLWTSPVRNFIQIEQCWEQRWNFTYALQLRKDFTEPIFKELTAGQLQLRGDLLFQISPISVMQYGKYGQISSTPQPRQLFVKNAYKEFHENPTNGVVADTRSRTEGHGLQIRRSFFTSKRNLKHFRLT